eukprot:IDg10437t1
MLDISQEASNTEEKALEVMRMCMAATQEAFGDDLHIFFGPMIADSLLFLRMCKIIHNAPPGERNAGFGQTGSSALTLDEFAPAMGGDATKPLEEVYGDLRLQKCGTYHARFNLKVDEYFFTPQIATVGEKIVEALEVALSDISKPNTRFVCMSILDFLIPP